MDFAALLSAAADNAKTAGKAVSRLDSEADAEKKKKLETQRKERLREKEAVKKLSTQPPAPSFKIPVVRKEQTKEVKKAVPPPTKATIKTPSFTAKKDQPKGVAAPQTKPKMAAKPQPKPSKAPVKPLVHNNPKGKENLPQSRKRPPVDFANLMQMATDISQGKKAEEPKEPPKKSPKIMESFRKPPAPTARIPQKPALPQIQTSISAFIGRKPEKEISRKPATVIQRKENVDFKRYKAAIERRRSGYSEETYRKKEKYIEEEEEEDDDDMSDFIDDDEVEEFDQQEMTEALRAINRKYDTDKWRQRERTIIDRHMAADYRTIAREEAQSARIGRIEDALEMKRRGTTAV